ncbi:MAG: rhomboid family intramembrane serine protease [Arenicellales bacterium]
MNIDIKALPKITLTLISISLIVALISRLGANVEALKPLFISWYIDNGLSEIRNGEIWRLITPIFLHFGAMHLIFNLTMTWQLGDLLERALGPFKFLALVLVLAISSNLAEYFYSGPGFGGLSGVLYGLFGYFWIASKFNPRFAYRINPGAVKMLLVWFVLCWFNFFGLLGGIQVANMAHTGGLVAGMLIAYLGARVSED